MNRSSMGLVLRAAQLIRQQTPRLDERELLKYVQSFLDRREQFVEAAHRAELPLYVIDTATLSARARRFQDAFAPLAEETRVFFAVKSNSHPLIASTLIDAGLGLDVSSGLELQQALDLKAERIVFSGPGKSEAELRLAVAHSDRVTVLMDSPSELERLERVASEVKTPVRAGLRLTTDDTGIWRKFGVPLDRLAALFAEADKCHYVRLRGLQFHLSWNLSAEPHVVFLARLGATLHRLSAKHRQQIRFIDLGGGYWPEAGEWLQPAGTPDGMVRVALDEASEPWSVHYQRHATPITTFAANIGQALQKHIPPDMHYAIFAEPGRWLCHNAMHILLKVADRKADDVVITDGGTNAIGWERFETDYFPVINLTRPSLREHECLVAGSLCTPHDIWGYSYFGAGIGKGDILLVPDQGAYTYSLRQEFIKPLPGWTELPSAAAQDGRHR